MNDVNMNIMTIIIIIINYYFYLMYNVYVQWGVNLLNLEKKNSWIKISTLTPLSNTKRGLKAFTALIQSTLILHPNTLLLPCRTWNWGWKPHDIVVSVNQCWACLRNLKWISCSAVINVKVTINNLEIVIKFTILRLFNLG